MKKFFKNKYNIVIVILIAVILFLLAVVVVRSKPIICDWNLIKYNFKGNCVPDEESAIEIAKVIYKVRTGIELENDAFKVRYDKEYDAWNVSLINYAEVFGDSMILGDLGIYINKDYATIVKDYSHVDEVKRHQETKEKYLGKD